MHNSAKAQAIHKEYHLSDTIIQSTSDANPEHFYTELIELLIFEGINNYLQERNLPTLKHNALLQQVAQNQSGYMANNELVSPEQDNKETKLLADRMQFYGGSNIANEIVDKTNINKGKIPFSYAKIADDLVFKWISNGKKIGLFTSGKYNLMGIGVSIDNKGRRIYVSTVVGNAKSFNQGVALKNQLTVPYSEKLYGLTSNPNYCKKLNKYANLSYLQKGLIIEDNIIYLELQNAKELKKIIKNKKDGLAVDILQQAQFVCNSANIVDHNLPNIGYLTKRVYSKKLFKKNLANTNENPQALKTKLGEMPTGIGESELNLVIVQNKNICPTVHQSFLIKPKGEFSQKAGLLGDTLTINSAFRYKPVADSVFLSFKIPFELNKYDYKPEDIEPFLELLNEPNFSIYDLKITAFSSIEGSDEKNISLQQNRAQSIVLALEKRQDLSMDKEIVTDYNWEDFKTDIVNTKHKALAKKSLKETQAYIAKNKLETELEPILSKHRYAKIEMNVIYSIVGSDEIPFVLRKFEKAIIAEDRPLALSVEKFILNQITLGRYSIEILKKLNIPLNIDYAGMEMNRIWMQFEHGSITLAEFQEQIFNLQLIDPDNEYIAYNAAWLRVNDSINDLNNIGQIQNNLDRLYYTPLKKSVVDKLNIKFQLKVLDAISKLGPNEKVKKAIIKRLQEIIDIERLPQIKALKLAELAFEIDDYNYALKAMEPWIVNGQGKEELVYSYLSICSLKEDSMHSDRFNRAMAMAKHHNPMRYCELFKDKGFSLKVLENPVIKESYCKSCNE